MKSVCVCVCPCPDCWGLLWALGYQSVALEVATAIFGKPWHFFEGETKIRDSKPRGVQSMWTTQEWLLLRNEWSNRKKENSDEEYLGKKREAVCVWGGGGIVTVKCPGVRKSRWGDKVKTFWFYSFMRKYFEWILLIYMIRKYICLLLLSEYMVYN